MKLTFTTIKNGTIFEPEFQSLSTSNGTIEFRHRQGQGGLAVVYAPNGTGKSSLAKVLGSEESSASLDFACVDDAGRTITPSDRTFHIIQDQLNRNVIRGKETDYLVGQQIRREYELRDEINKAFQTAFEGLVTSYKSDFKVTKVGDYLLKVMAAVGEEPHTSAYDYIRDIVNTRYRGKNINREEFVSFIRNDNSDPNTQIHVEPEEKQFIIQNTALVERFLNIDYHTLIPDTGAVQIERHDDAIRILEKYADTHSCIVCDNPEYDGEQLLRRKNENRKRIYDGLDQRTKDILDKVVKDAAIQVSDPYEIKRIAGDFISGADGVEIHRLQIDLDIAVHAICDEMILRLIHCFDGTDFFAIYDEFQRLVEQQPQLDSAELMYIEKVINENIGKEISVVRDEETKNYKLKLDDKNLLGVERNALELSTGEQNFISLAFELLLARHSDKEYIVLDDPISSFDSLYKNKIAYCIILFLENKKQIVLTHNLDLVRLLYVQQKNCFNLYMLNNVEDGQNGFIPVKDVERDLLINMHDLVKLFQNKDNGLVPAIEDRRAFLMSMIPFMRGYAHVSLDRNDYYGKLSGIMHGYGDSSIDVVPIYEQLFGYRFEGEEIISSSDILQLDCENLLILDKEQYPLLAETLEQTLIYYYLRMTVEKSLVEIFNLQTRDMDTLNQIIFRAFPKDKDTDEMNRRFRVFFTSRKTLLNEFNHFEGNMNIFQPAIDINPAALRKEVDDILVELEKVREYVQG